jgi:hypothetical protein
MSSTEVAETTNAVPGDTGAWMLCEWQRGAVKVVDSRAYASYGDVGGEC